MANKVIAGTFSIIVLAFVLVFFGTVADKLGTNFFANIIDKGIQGIRGG